MPLATTSNRLEELSGHPTVASGESAYNGHRICALHPRF